MVTQKDHRMLTPITVYNLTNLTCHFGIFWEGSIQTAMIWGVPIHPSFSITIALTQPKDHVRPCTKNLNYSVPIKYVIPKSLKVGNWLFLLFALLMLRVHHRTRMPTKTSDREGLVVVEVCQIDLADMNHEMKYPLIK